MESHSGGAAAGGETRSSVSTEVKKQLRLAAPLAVGCLLQKIIFTISLLFVGRLGELALASASLATSFASVTGFSVLRGMASTLDTLCGQAFGAGQHQLLGVHMQRATLVLALASVPVSLAWAYSADILVAVFRQDPAIAAGAGRYMRCMVPALFLYGPVECHARFLQAQNAVVPVMLGAGATAAVHVAACWVMVRGLGMGAEGAALGTAVAYLFNLCFLALYVRMSPACNKQGTCWTVGFFSPSSSSSREAAFQGIPGFLKLAVPSALMLCMEWWAFEILVLLSGILPNPKLETAVLSICFNTYAFAYMLPLGLSYAVSIRVSNELGAGRPQEARLATRVVILLALSLGVSEGLVMVLVRNVLGYAYSNEKEVAVYTAKMMPILAVSVVFDSIQSALSGVVRGCGRQNIGASINLAAYYLAGIPTACVLTFVFHLRGMGLFLGITCGLVVQMLLLLSICLRTNWDKEALKAKDRSFISSQRVELIAPSSAEDQTDGCSAGSVAKDTAEATTGATEGSVDPK